MVEFRVGELAPQDAGRGIARVTQAGQEELEVEPGDTITITGRRGTVAKVASGYKGDNAHVIRIDGNVRANADVNIGDSVEVESVEPKPASSVTVALPNYVILRGADPLIHRYLANRPVIRGDTVQMRLLGHPFIFLITQTSPSGPTIVTQETDVRVRETPITEDDLRGQQTALPDTTYEDIGGLGREVDLIREMIELPLRHPELFRRLGVAPPKGVLLHGPPGTGKTLIAKAVANEVDASFHEISGPEIMSKYYGESEQHLREVFEEAQKNTPAILFIDEIDSIAPSRDEVTGETERRVVAQLLSLMDGLEARGDVIVIAATNRPDAIDTALRRGGRFDREIEIGVPGREGRQEILQIHTRGMPLADDVELEELAADTHGFVGADLASFVREAAMHAIRRVQPDLDLEAKEIPADVLEQIEVTVADFEETRRRIEPSAMREVFVEIPEVTYDDVGGLDPVKHELVRAVEWPLRYPGMFAKLHTEAPKGVLLYGPPGTGKTLLARAVANASGVNFISVKGPELLDKFVGESEKAVREVFQRARQTAPTIIFFDEIDAIAPERGGSFDSHVTERVVSQLLTELDGVEELSGVFVLGATNRPDVIDPALLRPGRLEKNIYVPVPDQEARHAIFDVHTRGVAMDDDVNLDELAADTEGYTGGDIEAIVREASMLAMDDVVTELVGEDETVDDSKMGEATEGLSITRQHFRRALRKVKPSVTEERQEFYERLVDELGGKPETDAGESNLGFQ